MIFGSTYKVELKDCSLIVSGVSKSGFLEGKSVFAFSVLYSRAKHRAESIIKPALISDLIG